MPGALLTPPARPPPPTQGLEEDLGYLVGDCLLAAAFLSYMGPFLTNYRDEIVTQIWIRKVRQGPGPRELLGSETRAAGRTGRHPAGAGDGGGAGAPGRGAGLGARASRLTSGALPRPDLGAGGAVLTALHLR